MNFNLNHEKFYGIEEEMDSSFGTHFDDHHFYSSFEDHDRIHYWFVRVFFAVFAVIFFAIVGYIIFVLWFVCCKLFKGKGDSDGFSYREAPRTTTCDGPPVIVTTTTHSTNQQQVPGTYPANCYPPPAHGYPMPQPQPGYQPYPQAAPYPSYGQNMTSYSTTVPVAGPLNENPPSYDQVIRAQEAHQKQLPYNPNYTGQ